MGEFAPAAARERHHRWTAAGNLHGTAITQLLRTYLLLRSYTHIFVDREQGTMRNDLEAIKYIRTFHAYYQDVCLCAQVVCRQVPFTAHVASFLQTMCIPY